MSDTPIPSDPPGDAGPAAAADGNSGGAFRRSLMRNNTEIRQDRAESLAGDAETFYRRQVEDLDLELRRLQRSQEDLLDLSPTDADSLVLAVDFDSEAYAAKDLAMAVQIRNTRIKRDLATTRYQTLFGSAAGNTDDSTATNTISSPTKGS